MHTPLAPMILSTGVATVQERIPPELLSHDDVVTKADDDRRREMMDSGQVTGPTVTSRSMRSVLALFFLALVAAAVGGISVMKCERDRTANGETRGGGP
jgi:hypothetical protein